MKKLCTHIHTERILIPVGHFIYFAPIPLRYIRAAIASREK
jgi:hypothetical protein